MIVAGGKRPAAARDPRTGLMGEHPVRIQAKMIMAVPPRGSYRVRLVNHERITTSPADRPGSRQTGRASADDHHTLIHGPSVDPSPPAVNKTNPLPPARRRRIARDPQRGM